MIDKDLTRSSTADSGLSTEPEGPTEVCSTESHVELGLGVGRRRELRPVAGLRSTLPNSSAFSLKMLVSTILGGDRQVCSAHQTYGSRARDERNRCGTVTQTDGANVRGGLDALGQYITCAGSALTARAWWRCGGCLRVTPGPQRSLTVPSSTSPSAPPPPATRWSTSSSSPVPDRPSACPRTAPRRSREPGRSRPRPGGSGC